MNADYFLITLARSISNRIRENPVSGISNEVFIHLTLPTRSLKALSLRNPSSNFIIWLPDLICIFELKLVIPMDKIPTHRLFYIYQQANVGLYL
jgi:hypothetical protein